MITARRMPLESRDRLSRPVDIAAAYARWRSGIRPDGDSILFQSWGWNGGRRPTTTDVDWPGRIQLRSTTGGTRIQIQGLLPVVAVGNGGASLRTPRIGMTSTSHAYATPLPRRENTPLGASGRRLGSGSGGRRNTPLPSWHLRTPLADVTSVVGAYDIRRSRPSEVQGHTQDSPVPQPAHGDLNTSSTQPSGAPLEHDPIFCTPASRVKTKHHQPSLGKVRNILLDVTKQPVPGDSEFLTPQRKLLDQIDTVQKVVMEELRKLEKTPSAKKAERQKRIQTLMAMR